MELKTEAEYQVPAAVSLVASRSEQTGLEAAPPGLRRPKWTAVMAICIGVSLAAFWLFRNMMPPVLRIDIPINQTVYLNDWQLLGPFDWNEAAPTAASAPGSAVLGRQLDHPFVPSSRVEGGSSADLPWFASNHFLTRHSGHDGLVRLGDGTSNCSFRVYYAETRVTVSNDTDLALLSQNDDAAKIWLNGQLVRRSPVVARFAIAYTPVHLTRGINTLLVKFVRVRVTDLREPWDFVIGLTSFKDARADLLNRSAPAFIPDVIVEAGSPLTIDLSLFPAHQNASIRLSQRGRVVLTNIQTGGKALVSLSPLDEGWFSIVINVASDTIKEGLLYGSIDHLLPVYERSLSEGNNLAGNNSASDALFRLRHLMSKPNRQDADPLWQRKVVHLAAIADAAGVMSSTPDSELVSTTYFRNFQSSIDGSLQHYLLHVPRNSPKGVPIPLVVIVPVAEAPLRPFLESRSVADQENLERLDHAADRDGFAYLMYNDRGNTSGQPIGFAALFEAVASARSAFPLDPNRAYLLGVCGGGRDALKLAALFPGRFAAVAVLSPALQYLAPAEMDPARPTDKFAAEYINQVETLRLLRKLRHVPILSVHGSEDRHVPFTNSLALEAEAKKYGLPFTVKVIPGATQTRYPVDPYNFLFDFFKGKKLEHPADQHTPAEKTISIDSAFTSSFLVVMAPPDGKQSPARQAALKFAESWRARFFVDCRLKAEAQLSADDIASNNLVVFGTAAPNSLLARLQLPSAAELAKTIKLNAGPARLSLQAIFPNPLNHKKYVVMAGSSALAGCPQDATQLALKGWYGAALWTQDGNAGCHPAAVGFIDYQSRRFQTVRQPSSFLFLSRGAKGSGE